MSNAEVLEILITSRKAVEEGWIQGQMFDDAGNCCALGGLKVGYRSIDKPGSTRLSEVWDAWDAAKDAVRLAIVELHYPHRSEWREDPGYYISIADWNDTKGRTKAEVLAVFDRAINNTKEIS